MSKLPSPSNENGQALLIVLLSMSVVLTVVLSILSRTITDVRVTTYGEESLRAFSAAEAGIEKALIVGSTSGDFGSASFDVEVNDLGNAATYHYPDDLYSGESATIWFVEHNENGQLECSGDCFTGNQIKVCWGKAGTSPNTDKTPAVEISVFYAVTPGDYSTVRIARETADPNSPRRSANSFNGISGLGCKIDGFDFAFQKTIDFSSLGIPSSSYNNENGLQFAKIRFFYNDDEVHPVAVDVTGTGNNLPSQGVRLISVGKAGEANRKIEVQQSFGELPSIFDNTIYTPGGVVK